MLFRRSLIAAVPVLLFLTLPIQELAFAQPSINEQNSVKFDRFEVPTDGVTIWYPPNWQKDAKPPYWQQDPKDHFIENSFRQVMGFYSPLESNSDPYQESLVIRVDDAPADQDLPLSKVVNELTNSYKESLPDFKLLISQATTFNGMPAYKTLYTYFDSGYEPDGIKVQTKDVFLKESGKIFVISYIGTDREYSGYVPTIQRMYNSFSLEPLANVQPSQNPPTPNPSPEPAQNPANSSVDLSGWFVLFFFILLIVIFVAIIRRRLRGKKRKPVERLDFSESDKVETLRKQDHRCAICRRILNVVDWHHKNGDRSNNHISNCQALCPNCHADRTRRRFVK